MDGGHGALLRGLDQGKVWLNVNWDTQIRRVPPSVVLPRNHFKGSRRKLGAESPKARASVFSSPWVAGSLPPYTSVDLYLGTNYFNKCT